MFTDSVIAGVPFGRSFPRFDQQYNLTVVTPPPVPAVSIEDLTEYLRLDDDCADTDLVVALEQAGREYVETYCQRTFIQTSYTCQVDTFNECMGLRLPRRPVTAVTGITYIDQGGNQQTLPTNQYTVDTKLFTRIRPAPYVILPLTYPGQPNAVTVSFTAGAPVTTGNSNPPAGIPKLATLAIKSWVAAQYENREAVNTGKSGSVLPHSFEAVLSLLSAPEIG